MSRVRPLNDTKSSSTETPNPLSEAHPMSTFYTVSSTVHITERAVKASFVLGLSALSSPRSTEA